MADFWIFRDMRKRPFFGKNAKIVLFLEEECDISRNVTPKMDVWRDEDRAKNDVFFACTFARFWYVICVLFLPDKYRSKNAFFC